MMNNRWNTDQIDVRSIRTKSPTETTSDHSGREIIDMEVKEFSTKDMSAHPIHAIVDMGSQITLVKTQSIDPAYDSSQDPTVIDASGSIIKTGEMCTAQLEIEMPDGKQEIATIDCREAIIPDDLIISPDHTSNFHQHEKPDRDKKKVRFTFELNSKDGSKIPITVDHRQTFPTMMTVTKKTIATNNRFSSLATDDDDDDDDEDEERVEPSDTDIKAQMDIEEQMNLFPFATVDMPKATNSSHTPKKRAHIRYSAEDDDDDDAHEDDPAPTLHHNEDGTTLLNWSTERSRKSLHQDYDKHIMQARKAGGKRLPATDMISRQKHAAATYGYRPGDNHATRLKKKLSKMPAKLLQTSLLLSLDKLKAGLKHSMWSDTTEVSGEALRDNEDQARFFADNSRNPHSHKVKNLTGLNFGDRIHTDVFTNNSESCTKEKKKNPSTEENDSTPLCKDRFYNATHFIIFVDQATRYTAMYSLKGTKTEDIFERVEDFVRDHDLQSRTKAMELFCDQGTYYTSKRMDALCRESNIIPQFSEAKEGSTNGLAERTVGWIKERAAIALQQANLDDTFFGVAADYVIHLKNRSPHSTLLANKIYKTPFELVYKYKPSVAEIPIFGTPCTAVTGKNVSSSAKNHRSPIRAVFVGFSRNSDAYRIVQLETFSGVILDESTPALKVKISEQSPIRVKLDRWFQHPLIPSYPLSILRDRLVKDRMQHIQQTFESARIRYQFDDIKTKKSDITSDENINNAKEDIIDSIMMGLPIEIASENFPSSSSINEISSQDTSSTTILADNNINNIPAPQEKILPGVLLTHTEFNNTFHSKECFQKQDYDWQSQKSRRERQAVLLDSLEVYECRQARKISRRLMKLDATDRRQQLSKKNVLKYPNNHFWKVKDEVQFYPNPLKMQGVGIFATVKQTLPSGYLLLTVDDSRDKDETESIHHSQCIPRQCSTSLRPRSKRTARLYSIRQQHIEK